MRTTDALAIVFLLSGCAATSPNYKPPHIKGNEPAIVISGARVPQGSACLSTILIDGEVAGTVGSYETLVIPIKPGKYFVRWDRGGTGLCPLAENLAHRLVVVDNSPVLLKLDISGTSKVLIPVVGAFLPPSHRILAEGED